MQCSSTVSIRCDITVVLRGHFQTIKKKHHYDAKGEGVRAMSLILA